MKDSIEFKILNQRIINKSSSIKANKEQNNKTENKSNEILELLQKFIVNNQLIQ